VKAKRAANVASGRRQEAGIKVVENAICLW